MKKMRLGFTLIELLIVVAIIAILALIAVPNFLEAQTRSKVARTRNDLRSVDMAAKALLIDKGEEAYLVDFWDDDQAYGRDRITNVFGGVGNSPEATRRQVDVLAPLTTPIAYMTSLPRDPFIPNISRFISGGNSEIAFKEGNESYIFMDEDPGAMYPANNHNWNLDGYPGGDWKAAAPAGAVPRLKVGEWWFIGYGPVLAPTNSGIRSMYAYDPTNGTVSLGCVFRRSGGEPY